MSASAAEVWRTAAEAMAVPDDLVAGAARSPHRFDAEFFASVADAAVRRGPTTASDLIAGQALGDGGSLLDVGAGAGAASLVHAGRAGRITAVDPSAELLAAFAKRAGAVGVDHREVAGTWPEVAAEAGASEVVVCHDVAYNVADLAAFLTALDAAATRRVVVQLTATHPLAYLAGIWRDLHGWRRPQGPTADVAVAAAGELGLDVTVTTWQRRRRPKAGGDGGLARTAQLVGARDDQLDRLAELLVLHPAPESRDVVTLAWDR